MNTVTVVFQSEDEHNLLERLQELDNELRRVQRLSEVGLVYVSHTVNGVQDVSIQPLDWKKFQSVHDVSDQSFDWNRFSDITTINRVWPEDTNGSN